MNYTAVRNFNKKLSRVEKTVCRAAVVRRSEDNEVFSEDLRHKDLEDDTCIRYDEEEHNFMIRYANIDERIYSPGAGCLFTSN